MLVAASWIGFLLGYAVSSHTGGKSAVAAKAPAAGGYGLPSGGAAKAPAVGGYGLPLDKGSGKRGAGEGTGAPPR
jgi:hypothetical protein